MGSKQGGGRKFGRDTREPSHTRYNNEHHLDKNRMRRAKRRANKFGQTVRIKYHNEMVDVEPDK